MPKSKNTYLDRDGNVLVSVGDELTPNVVQALGVAKACRLSDIDDVVAAMEFSGADTVSAEVLGARAIAHFGPCSDEAKRVCEYMEGTAAEKRGLIHLAMRGELSAEYV